MEHHRNTDDACRSDYSSTEIRLKTTWAVTSIAENPALPAIIRTSALEKLLPYGGELSWPDLIQYLTHKNPFIRATATRLFQQSPTDVAIENLVPRLSDETRAVRIAATRSLIAVPPELFTPDQGRLLSVALKEFHKSLVASADHPNTQMALAGLALSFRNVRAGKAAILEALSIDPQLTDAWIMKAKLENAERRPDLVEKTMEDAQKSLPNSTVIFQFFGNYMASQRQYDRAIDNLKKAVTMSENDPDVITNYVAVLSQAGDYHEALLVMNALLAKQPDNETVLFLKANVTTQHGYPLDSLHIIRGRKLVNKRCFYANLSTAIN